MRRYSRGPTKYMFFYGSWWRGLGSRKASAFRTFVRFALVWFCLFPLPLDFWKGLRSYFFLLCGLFYEAIYFMSLPCVVLFLCFSVLLALRLPRLGKRELILVLFVRLFDLCLFSFIGFLFLLVSGKGWSL